MSAQPILFHTASRQPFRVEVARVEEELEYLLGNHAPDPGPVSRAMRYAVLGGEAQRVRPVITQRIARMVNADPDLSLRAAAATELLHTASLIVDDLPCMDNDAMRRGKPACHVAFGESTAVLAAFSLVALAARCVVEQPCAPPMAARQRAFQLALLRTLDVSELINGQAMDLELAGAEREMRRQQMSELKTVPLFKLAVDAGLAYAQGPVPVGLERFGREFGLAFQLADDILDGENVTLAGFRAQLDAARNCLPAAGNSAQPLEELLHYLHARTQETHRRHR
jgi:geranylgeranyl pyrophosphate synthase